VQTASLYFELCLIEIATHLGPGCVMPSSTEHPPPQIPIHPLTEEVVLYCIRP